MADLVNEFLSIKKQLLKERDDIDTEILRLQERRERISEILSESLIIESPAKDFVALDADAVYDTREQRIVDYVTEHPGCNGADIRAVFNGHLTENQIKAAITYCSSNNLIVNKGTKRLSKWYAK